MERLDLMPIRVKLPGLSVEFWSINVFKAIGSALGVFYEADLGYVDSGIMSVARILVGTDIHEGLALKMELVS